MTVGKFTWGTIKFVVNFVVIIMLGMSAYFIYSTITTMPVSAELLELEPAGTNFGVDPEKFTDGEAFGKILKGDYFIDGADGMGEIKARDALNYGLTYFPYDYASNYPASAIYANTDMTKINLWLGAGSIAGRYGYEFDDYDYAAGRPRMQGDSLIAPTFSFNNLDDMKAQLYGYFDDKPGDEIVADTIIAYWTLRIGSQVESYVQFKGERMTAEGGGAGGMSGVNLTGDTIISAINFNYYGYKLAKSTTMITKVSASFAKGLLGSILTVTDFRFTGNGVSYAATANDEPDKLSADPYTGPDGAYKSKGETSGTAPTLNELQALYDSYAPQRSGSEAKDNLDGLKLCEFGMPAKTFSAHTIDLRTIKSVELKDTNDYYATDMVCYTYSDGAEWEFVSKNSASDLAGAIGGYAANGGPVSYLYYTTLTVSIQVYRSGLVRAWGTQENWDAALAGIIEAKVIAGSKSVYTFDLGDILADKNNLGVSLPDQLEKLLALF
ncbi:MAG: hypothetical protein LBP79_05520 [Clostridiales bacterium]|jgi:hypothetical protein|nr:hypothetical protein [Clostridiales bacterium]